MIHGILNIRKEKQFTSHDVVAKLRGILRQKKIGHTGTLDPMAEGVLIVCLGTGTKLVDMITAGDKEYKASMQLGISTDTEDITGEVLSENEPDFTQEKLKEALEKLTGKQLQYPPVFSAIKKDGVPLYKLARKGQEVVVQPCEITVHSIKLLEFSPKEYTFKIDVLCSKGTYIRSLCRDIGEYLGCGAAMTELTRTKTGSFSLEQCVDLDSLNTENISEYLLDEELAVEHLPCINVSEKQAVRFSNGGKLDFDRLKGEISDGNYYRIKHNESFIGIGYADGEKREIRIKCLINPI